MLNLDSSNQSMTDIQVREWRVLQTLAQAPNPAQACHRENWRSELFSEETSAVFLSVLQARSPIEIPVPTSLDGLQSLTADEMREARQAMTWSTMLLTLLPTFQANLRDELTVMLTRAEETDQEPTTRSKALEAALDAMLASTRRLQAIVDPKPRDSMRAMTLGDASREYWQRIEEMQQAVSTGFRAIDRYLGRGLLPGRLFVVLGGPGAGKTSLVNQIAESAASSGRPVVYITTEEPIYALHAKTLARLGNVDYTAVLQGYRSERAKIDAAMTILAGRRSAERLLYIEGSGVDLETLQEAASEHFVRYADTNDGGGPGILVVDYLQKMGRALSLQTGRDLRMCVSAILGQLGAIAKQCNCTVIALSSQSRSSGYGTSNAISSAKESGDIEYDADVVLCIGKDEERVPPVGCKARTLFFAKNRLGPEEVTINFDFKGDRQRFTEEARDDDDE